MTARKTYAARLDETEASRVLAYGLTLRQAVLTLVDLVDGTKVPPSEPKVLKRGKARRVPAVALGSPKATPDVFHVARADGSVYHTTRADLAYAAVRDGGIMLPPTKDTR